MCTSWVRCQYLVRLYSRSVTIISSFILLYVHQTVLPQLLPYHCLIWALLRWCASNKDAFSAFNNLQFIWCNLPPFDDNTKFCHLNRTALQILSMLFAEIIQLDSLAVFSCSFSFCFPISSIFSDSVESLLLRLQFKKTLWTATTDFLLVLRFSPEVRYWCYQPGTVRLIPRFSSPVRYFCYYATWGSCICYITFWRCSHCLCQTDTVLLHRLYFRRQKLTTMHVSAAFITM